MSYTVVELSDFPRSLDPNMKLSEQSLNAIRELVNKQYSSMLVPSHLVEEDAYKSSWSVGVRENEKLLCTQINAQWAELAKQKGVSDKDDN